MRESLLAPARARYFRYEVTLSQNLAKAGPAFGIRAPDNFFAVTWDRPSEGFRLYKVVDGHKPEVIAYHSTTYTQANRILRIEVTSSGGADYCTVTLDPYTTPVVLFNNEPLAAHGYTGGQFGAYCSFSLTTSAILDDIKLWIDEEDEDETYNFNQQVFNDDFSSAVVSISHDNNGNLTSDGVYQYVYDAWNRLVQVKAGQTGSAGSRFATYRYDGLGRRVGKAVGHSGDADTTEWYYYSGHRLLETRNGSGYATCQYVWGTRYIDELIREDINGDPGAGADDAARNNCLDAADAGYYFYQDANYNVALVTDASAYAVPVQQIRYSAYGRPSFTDADGRSRSGPTFGPAGNQLPTTAVAWQGLFNDLETGHSYNRARTLDHRLGRFMQRDPAGHTDGHMLYEYVKSRPMNVTDPTGLKCCLWVDYDLTMNDAGTLFWPIPNPGPTPGQLCFPKTTCDGSSNYVPTPDQGGTCAARILTGRAPWCAPKPKNFITWEPTGCKGICKPVRKGCPGLGDAVATGKDLLCFPLDGNASQREKKIAEMCDKKKYPECTSHVIIDDNNTFSEHTNCKGTTTDIHRYPPEEWKKAVDECCRHGG